MGGALNTWRDRLAVLYVCRFRNPIREVMRMARSKSKHIRMKTTRKQAWKARAKRKKAAKKTAPKK